jgi:sugar lactone lactonase YvrE
MMRRCASTSSPDLTGGPPAPFPAGASPVDIFVYTKAGTLIDRIRTPERPTNLAFGGSDGHTLYIAARSGLYSLHTIFAGQPRG